MIDIKILKDLLKNIPDDAFIYIPSKTQPDTWVECEKLEISVDDNTVCITFDY